MQHIEDLKMGMFSNLTQLRFSYQLILWGIILVVALNALMAGINIGSILVFFAVVAGGVMWLVSWSRNVQKFLGVMLSSSYHTYTKTQQDMRKFLDHTEIAHYIPDNYGQMSLRLFQCYKDLELSHEHVTTWKPFFGDAKKEELPRFEIGYRCENVKARDIREASEMVQSVEEDFPNLKLVFLKSDRAKVYMPAVYNRTNELYYWLREGLRIDGELCDEWDTLSQREVKPELKDLTITQCLKYGKIIASDFGGTYALLRKRDVLV